MTLLRARELSGYLAELTGRVRPPPIAATDLKKIHVMFPVMSGGSNQSDIFGSPFADKCFLMAVSLNAVVLRRLISRIPWPQTPV